MFAFELSGLTLSLLGVYRRSHLGFLALEKEKAFQEKIADSLAKESQDSGEGESIEKRRSEERAGEDGATAAGGEAVGGVEEPAELASDCLPRREDGYFFLASR